MKGLFTSLAGTFAALVLALAIVLALTAVLAAAASPASSNERCVTTYTRAQFHNVAGNAFDGRAPATARERRQLNRVLRCLRFPKSRPLVRFHLHRYRETHRVELRVQAMGTRGIAWRMLRERGLLSEFGCLDQLVHHESGWDPYAENPASGAYGLGQALPGSKMAVAGAAWRTDPYVQLRWLIVFYIPGRYGTPCAAWAFWQVHRWY